MTALSQPYSRQADKPLLPWQSVTLGSGLALCGPADIRCDHGAMAAEFERLDATAPEDARSRFGSRDGEWTAMELVGPGRDPGGPGIRTPLLAAMPSAADLISRLPSVVRRAHLMRLGPRGLLDWHFDNQAIHLEECRLLVAIHAPPGAVTLMGHEAISFPEGQVWSGDFSFPHRVENPAERQRIMLIMDLRTSPELARLLPPALGSEVQLRTKLAQDACNALLAARAEVLTAATA